MGLKGKFEHTVTLIIMFLNLSLSPMHMKPICGNIKQQKTHFFHILEAASAIRKSV